MLADRMAFLDRQNEELRGELITLRRKQHGDTSGSDPQALQQRIRELEGVLRQGQAGRRLVIYGPDRIEANLPHEPGFDWGRIPAADVNLLICHSAARLLIITSESQVFQATVADLPSPPPDNPAAAAPFGNPRNVAAILDQSVFERCRFLVLVSQAGYVYSILAGTVSQVTRRQEKLVRNLIPGDPIVAAVPSYNADLLAVSRKGRWARFREKAVAGSGSLVMELPKGDALANVIPVSQEIDLVFLAADGTLFVRPSSDFKARQAPGTSGGMLLKGQTFQGVLSGDEFTVLTRQGKLITVRPADLSYRARTETGTPLPGLLPGDTVQAFVAY
jgi:DNA gyrase/topoisomerase IV subunit A